VAALAQTTGQAFSNLTAIPVGFGIRRAGAAGNVPVGPYSDYRAVLSFPIPDDIPRNAIVQGAQLTLVQLPSRDSAPIPGFGDRGRGFFFLDATPHNLAANSVVLQEGGLGAAEDVLFTDFFAPTISGFVVLSSTGNVLGGDTSAGPRLVDVGPGVQRAVSAPGPRFYQVRLQCAREVWNNQATPAFATFVSSSVSGTASGAPFFQAVGSIAFAATGNAATTGVPFATYQVNTNNPVTVTITLLVTNPITVSFSVLGSTFSAFLPTTGTTISQNVQQLVNLGILQSTAFTGPPATNTNATASASSSLVLVNLVVPIQTFSYTANVSASFSISTSVTGTQAPANAAGFEISQGTTGTCRAEFDREPATGTGAGPITTARGPRLDNTFTVPR